MPKTYKHKTLWWIAKPAKDDDVRIKESLQWKYDIYKWDNYCNVNNHRMSEKELIELWFEIEKDWIDNSVEEFYKLWWEFINEKDLKEFREILEKHAPKQKKFSLSEISDFYRNLWSPMSEDPDCSNVYTFLKKHNLISSEEPLQN